MKIRKIVVIGAGYAGTMAANRVARSASDVQVTVVNSRPEFVERIRLHELIAGSGSATQPLRDMLDPRIDLVVGTVSVIGDGTVDLADGTSMPFDHLVYAVGGAVSAPAGTLAVGDLDSAIAARAALDEVPAGGVVTVVGGGLTGIETAAEVAEARPDVGVRLLSAGEVGASLGARARDRVLAELAALGVEVRRERYSGADDSALVLWAIASEVSDLATRSAIAVDGQGRVIVDEFLRSVSDPRIFAVGDAAAVPGSRMSCQAALPQGAHGAATLVRVLDGKAPKAFSMGFTGQNISLGRSRAVIQLTRRDDRPTRFSFSGKPAVLMKEQVCRMTRMVSKAGRYVWLPAPR